MNLERQYGDLTVSYEPAPDSESWWCNTHNRPATHLLKKSRVSWRHSERVCNPSMGGITLPCQCVKVGSSSSGSG